jgi:hypothetical protein
MKYVKFDDNTGAYEWDPYFEYLRTAKDRFPAGLFAYASSWDHYSLDSRDSLHDSWLQTVQLTGGIGGAGVEAIQLEFLGAYHDRLHLLSYSGVKEFAIRLAGAPGAGSRDLLVHEFRAEEDAFVHELLFAEQQSITIKFDSFAAKQQRLPSKPD